MYAIISTNHFQPLLFILVPWKAENVILVYFSIIQTVGMNLIYFGRENVESLSSKSISEGKFQFLVLRNSMKEWELVWGVSILEIQLDLAIFSHFHTIV